MPGAIAHTVEHIVQTAQLAAGLINPRLGAVIFAQQSQTGYTQGAMCGGIMVLHIGFAPPVAPFAVFGA